MIPVVLMTALSAIEDRVRGIEAGADDFLSKPVDERELLARIRTALSVKRAIDETVGELRSTSAHLEEFGRARREVVVLAVAWRPADKETPVEAAGFVSRRERVAAEELVRESGGMVCEGHGDLLVAVFDGSGAAVEAALAITGREPGTLVAGAAVVAGPAEVGSMRVGRQWTFGAAGEPVDEAGALARGGSGVVVSPRVSSELHGLFALAPTGHGAYQLLHRLESEAERRIRSILITDIVGSTATAERVGDRKWSRLLAAHDDVVREELGRFGGVEVDAVGDGHMAFFDAPAKAIRCALAIHERLRALGVPIRAGVHTGEIEETERRPSGVALHIAARIAGHADAGEVLVGVTTRELAAGAGLVFADRGEHLLKGVSEPRRLYAAFADPGAAPAPPPPADALSAGLTDREVDVLRLVALGLSDAEVAEQLHLSVRTVNAHLRSVYRKLGVRSRTAAGRLAHEHGLI